ncbi:protoporphyrinogen/coproporphyrinogen oxidase [Ectothiorhodospira mobilis]|uniref:protoporphyrinogen/coproporphyrinogen oxidase n=1 Tax=Ectothiorhodospira mobilis TaxID=195064 RepID=UPI001EE99089|nr:NAD(P)/FAD-dependent oxidoreductase [Ectothiorhodospira mobilis]MCG5536068.1 FAD-dependent oxidoreductase [Ectothiorhodospira mobilis]
MHADVVIIGGGLSGLACALTLREHGREPLILEAGDAPGGRVRSDVQDGFLLDRGFQVLQTWYPEARRFLDYDALDLRPFETGALVRFGGRMHRVSDVWRRPGRLAEMMFSPVGHWTDKLRLLGLRRQCLRGDLQALYTAHERDAITHLREMGFSSRIIERFFKAFFSGVFFDPELHVSSRAFEFVFRAFALGDTALPARGMEAIPRQLADRLPAGDLRLNTRVERLEGRRLILESGEQLEAGTVVVATPGTEAARLLGDPEPFPTRGTTCLYFEAPESPVSGPYLLVNGEGRGRVNNVVCPAQLSEHYAPAGRQLVGVNLHGAETEPEALEESVRAEMAAWFGESVRDWRLIRGYRIPEALPAQHPPVPYPGAAELRRGEDLWVCGEYPTAPSIQWALHTGRRAAEEIAAARGERAPGSASP